MNAFRIALATVTVALGSMTAALPAHATTSRAAAAPHVVANVNEVAGNGRARLKVKQGTLNGVVTTFKVIGSKPAANGVVVDVSQSTGFEASFTFAAPGGTALHVGSYKIATPQGDNGSAVLNELWDNAAVCPGIQGGTFKVTALKFSAVDGHVSQFGAAFTITCNARPLWKGKLAYREIS